MPLPDLVLDALRRCTAPERVLTARPPGSLARATLDPTAPFDPDPQPLNHPEPPSVRNEPQHPVPFHPFALVLVQNLLP
jgi:hypothetical protein